MGLGLWQKDPCLSRKILVVGGQARTARAFRRVCAGAAPGERIVLCRRPEDALPGECVHLVDDYFSPPASLLAEADVLVNFTGIIRGQDTAMRQLNAEGPAALAGRARDAGISHFVHISSLSVYGRAEDIDRATPERPATSYGRTKLAGDQALLALAKPGFLVSPLRVPTLYDAQIGKVTQLARLMKRLGFFPVAAAPQPRSIMHLHNFAIAVQQVILHQMDGIQLASDPDDLEIARLARAIERQTGRTVRQPRIPSAGLGALALLAPALHDSLFRKSLICPHVRIALPEALGFDAIVADIMK